MTPDPPRIYLDSCVPMSYLNGDADRVPHIDELFKQARRREVALYTSSVALTEVAYVGEMLETGISGTTQDQVIDRILRNRRIMHLVSFNIDIALEARRLVREAAERRRNQGRIKERELKPLDAIHLASASAISASTFLAYDSVYASLKTKFVFRFAEPRTAIAQSRMDL